MLPMLIPTKEYSSDSELITNGINIETLKHKITFYQIITKTGKLEHAIPSINEYYGLANAAMHSRKKVSVGTLTSGMIKKWRSHATYVAQQQLNITEPLKRAKIVILVYFPDKRLRDAHNLFYKPILDGFTDAGIWVDDSCVYDFRILGFIDKETPRVEFYIF